MAFNFVAASSQSLQINSAVASGVPLTMAAFFNNSSAPSASEIFISLLDELGNDRFNIAVAGLTVGDPVFAGVSSQSPNVASAANGSTGTTAQTWNHCGGAFASGSSRTVYLNGTLDASDTTTCNVGSLLITVIGARRTGSAPLSNFFNGQIAEAAIWNVALTDDEIASLAKGFKPTRVRPQSLVFYAPLIRNLQDTKGGLAITNNNSATVAEHPRVY